MKIVLKGIKHLSLILIPVFTFSFCQPASTSQDGHINLTITTDEFDRKLSEENVQLLDVRTQQEFSDGHLETALNYDVNSNDFEKDLDKLDKSKPVLVYCLSAGRSAQAATIMEKRGFVAVYNMRGGLLKWNAEGKPLAIANGENVKTGFSVDEFTGKLRTHRYVLVDYNAKWCKPCKRMLPMLEKFSEERKEKMSLLRVDVDENKILLSSKGITSVPYLELYENARLIWKHEGEISEEALLKETNL